MDDTYRITALEDKYFRVPWYVEVTTGTTGTITPPTGGTIVLNQWSGSVSAKSSTITVSEKPTGIPAKTSAGADITVTISTTGSWALSGTPSAYPIAIIYYYDVKLFNFNKAYSLDTIAAPAIHTRQHAITATADHTSTATSGKMLKADANGLPVDASNTDTEVASAVSLKHTQGTDTALAAVGTKNPPIDADKALYRDSVASDALVTSTWTQIKAFLKTYFDTLYNLYVHPNHSGEVTSVADGAQTIANKQTMSATAPITLSNTPTVIAAAAPVIAIPAATASVNGYATSVQITKLDGIEAAADVTDAVNIASSIVGVADKATPVDADSIGLIDSAAANVLKETTWASIKTTLKAYFDGIYAAVLGADDNYVTDAEKAALHAAATVADTDSLDLSLTGQQISGVVNQSWVMARSLFR